MKSVLRLRHVSPCLTQRPTIQIANTVIVVIIVGVSTALLSWDRGTADASWRGISKLVKMSIHEWATGQIVFLNYML